jgi:cytochrome c oxidase assembly protein subunit 11
MPLPRRAEISHDMFQITARLSDRQFVPRGLSPVGVHLGEEHQAAYTAINLGSEPILGTIIYNVTPPTIGKYFYKIQCFCFTEQLAMPGERKEFSVLFYVDPEIADDPEEHDLNTITLSYTLYNKGRDALEKYLHAHPTARGPDGS